MDDNTSIARGGGTLCFSLTSMGFITWLVFLILKVTGAWNISWFWVWFPFWLPWAISGAFVILAVLAAIILVAIDRQEKNNDYFN